MERGGRGDSKTLGLAFVRTIFTEKRPIKYWRDVHGGYRRIDYQITKYRSLVDVAVPKDYYCDAECNDTNSVVAGWIEVEIMHDECCLR